MHWTKRTFVVCVLPVCDTAPSGLLDRQCRAGVSELLRGIASQSNLSKGPRDALCNHEVFFPFTRSSLPVSSEVWLVAVILGNNCERVSFCQDLGNVQQWQHQPPSQTFRFSFVQPGDLSLSELNNLLLDESQLSCEAQTRRLTPPKYTTPAQQYR